MQNNYINQQIDEGMREYKKQLQKVRKKFNTPNAIDDLKISFDEKYIIFQFDLTTWDDGLVT
jgi:hypothetical protein